MPGQKDQLDNLDYRIIQAIFANSRISVSLIARKTGSDVWIMAVICDLFILQAIMFFIWVPGELISWTFAGPVLIGVLVTMIIGEILLYISGRQKRVN